MKKLALSSAALGAAMAVGTAQAEPLTLSADQMDQVTAGGFAFTDAFLNVFVDTFIFETVDIFKIKNINQFVNLDGYFSDAKSAANAFSPFGAEAITFTQTEANASAGYATSVSLSESAAEWFDFNNDVD
jgi:hypothetical protein